MVNQQVLTGKWNEVRGKINEKWGTLMEDDLQTFNGNVDQLVGAIQRKTGETRESIEHFLSDVAEEAASTADHLREQYQEGATQAADAARRGYDALRHGYGEAERTVQERPAQSVAIAFGLGIAAGVGLTLLFRERPSGSMVARGRDATEQFARQMLDALSNMVPNR